ncbi:MAG TPA: 16S rRNA (uracil(1498)-N(3))-methyltransferase [Spirochaetota bacterium]|nr:16S rRNA (uracil(1498)-N(3))-methyltransferase [Spirochaetota bacterium]
MNQILLFPEDYISRTKALLKGRRFDHLVSVLKARKGDYLRAGIAGDLMGEALVTELYHDHAVIEPRFTEEPPPPLPLTLILAMPRPKSLRKALHYAAAMGVKKIFLIRTWRVEKSYFDTPLLEEENLRRELVLAMEQARDTVLPEVYVKTLFRPFAEDELPALAEGTLKLIAHPESRLRCPRDVRGPVTLVVGPEGGFVDFELSLLESLGFLRVTMGERVLRVENAVPALIGRLF